MGDAFDPPPLLSPEPGIRMFQLPRHPVAWTYGLVGINLLIFVATALNGPTWLIRGGLIPAAVLNGEWWRMITSAFLHGSPLHIFTNLYALYLLGTQAERIFGRARYFLLYTFSLVGASAFVLAFTTPQTITVGASGAILGLMGGLVVYYWGHRDFIAGGRDYLGRLAQVVVFNIAIGLLPQVSLWGHLGGVIAGATLSWAIHPRYQGVALPEPHIETLPLWERMPAIAGVVAAWGLFLVGVLWLRG